jgi:anti-sigma factor RsiW
MSSRRIIAARLLVDENELEWRPLDDVKADLEALGIDPRPAINRVTTQAEALCREMNRDAAHNSNQARVGAAASEPVGRTSAMWRRLLCSPTAIVDPIPRSDGYEVPYEPQPARLRIERYCGHTAGWAKPLRWLGLAELSLLPRVAGIALLLLAGVGAGWILDMNSIEPELEPPAPSFTRQALNAPVLYASNIQHPVEFGADQEKSFLLWLSERLGQAVHAPNLVDLGFTLVGGRLLPASGQAAAQLMYENPDAERITLYIRSGWPASPGGAKDGTINFAGEGGVSTVYWTDGPLSYALGGALDREQLFAIAKIIQHQRMGPVVPPAEQSATTEKGAP